MICHSALFVVLLTIVSCGWSSGTEQRRRVRQVSMSNVVTSTISPVMDGNKHSAYPGSSAGHQETSSNADKFQVNKNSIIRTHDSRSLGAKYLNETDLTSNEDCLRWCWNTSTCNLAVYEEKTRGSCYLFDCGTLEDFKCRFTGHSFYTSSILQVNRNSYLLNEWKSQTKQENDLTGLKGVGPNQSGKSPDSFQGHPKSILDESVNRNPTISAIKVSKCRHYQFECRNSSECIAIYNVCDGIPQCADGSDEAVELECHKSRLNPAKSQSSGSESESVTTYKPPSELINPKGAILSKALSPLSATNQYNSLKTDMTANEAASKVGSLNYPPSYVNYNYPRTPNEKQQMMEDSVPYSSRAQSGVEYASGNVGGYSGLSGWSQYQSTGDAYKADKLNYGLAEADVAQQQYAANQRDPLYWPSFNYQSSADNLAPMPRSMHQSMVPSQGRDLPYPNGPPLTMADTQPRTNKVTELQVGQPALQPQAALNRLFGDLSATANTDQSSSNQTGTANGTPVSMSVGSVAHKAVVVTGGTSANGSAPVDYAKLSNDRKQVAVPSIVAISYLHDSSPQSGRETNSAVIALTLGLLVTTILVVIVGCRMKSFKKRLARRGRSLAHDADYLVNGLYL